MLRQVHYLDKSGPQNTDQCLAVTKELTNSGYRDIVIATTFGDTALKFAHVLNPKEINLVAVTHSAGFKNPNEVELTASRRKEIIDLGVKIYTGTILTHSLETALTKEYGGVYPTTLITHTLRRFSQGVKVCVEIVMEACDAGYLPEDKEVVAVGGTGRGADTVCIIKSAASKRFLDLKVLEILAKPRQ